MDNITAPARERSRGLRTQRIIAFCRRITDQLGAPPDLFLATHALARLRAGTRPISDAGPPPDNRSTNEAECLIRAWKKGRVLHRAEQIIELCEQFDDAVEFSALCGETVGGAILEFRDEPRGENDVWRAFLAITEPFPVDFEKAPLPVFPRAAAQLARLSVFEASAADLERIAITDPVMAARALGLANSARYPGSPEIASLREAILRIGVPLAHKALLDACLGRLFASISLQNTWHHSRETAAFAWEIAGQCGEDQDLAYLAGLIHDIGRIVLESCPPATRITELDWLMAGLPLVYAENLAYGCDHARIGSDLLARWNLDSRLVEAVACHGMPERSQSTLPSIIFLAEEAAKPLYAKTCETMGNPMRREIAARIAGVNIDSLNRESEVFALAG